MLVRHDWAGHAHTQEGLGEQWEDLTGNQRAGNNLQHPYLGLGCTAEVSPEGHDRRRALPLPPTSVPQPAEMRGKNGARW